MILTFARARIHPLFCITLAFILGIFAQLYTGHTHLAGLLLIVPLGLILQSNARILLYLTLAVAYIFGGVCLQWQQHEHAKLYSYAAGQTCDIIGTITDIHTVDHPYFNRCITLKTTQIKHHFSHYWHSGNYSIQLYTRSKKLPLVGDSIAINSLVFKKPSSKTTFDDYLIKEGIHATLFINDFNYISLDQPSTSWRRTLFNLREKLCNNIKNKMSTKTYMLFSSVFLGNKFFSKKSFEYIKEHFTTWGVTHYLARSGLHMVIFVMGWYFILNLLPIPFLLKELLIISISMSYFLLSWLSVSFIRAFFAFLLYRVGTLLHRPTDVLHILSIICLIILCCNPMQLFFLDFQLSFGLTFALAYFNQLQLHAKNQYPKTIA